MAVGSPVSGISLFLTLLEYVTPRVLPSTGLTVGYFPHLKSKKRGPTTHLLRDKNETLLVTGRVFRRRVALGNRQPDISLDDSHSDGVAGESGDVMDVKLAHEMLAMLVYRFEAHTQRCSDLLVSVSLGYELENLDLTRTQPVVSLLGVAQPV